MSGNHWLEVDAVILTVTAFLQAVSLIACLAHFSNSSFLAARASRGGVCGWGVGAVAVPRQFRLKKLPAIKIKMGRKEGRQPLPCFLRGGGGGWAGSGWVQMAACHLQGRSTCEAGQEDAAGTAVRQTATRCDRAKISSPVARSRSLPAGQFRGPRSRPCGNRRRHCDHLGSKSKISALWQQVRRTT